MSEKQLDSTRRVCTYLRISTEHEAQVSAFANQVDWSEQLIAQHPEWIIVDRYHDEGITGTSVEKRPEFMRMIQDAREGKFDLIVTKEVSRFARNTVATLSLAQELRRCGVEIYFVADNIWTMDGDGDLRLSLMATLAQEESRRISERVLIGQAVSRTNGSLYGNGNIFAYNRVNGNYEIDPEQACTVRKVYELYAGEMGYRAISGELTRLGHKNASGIVQWDISRVRRMLVNPVYKGYITYNKSHSDGYLTQKRINHREEDYVLVKGNFEPIVSEELWNKCAEIRAKKNAKCIGTDGKLRKFGRQQPRSVWCDKLRCSCGSAFRRFCWHKYQDGREVHGFECYRKKRSISIKYLQAHGLDESIVCQTKSIPSWHIDLMARTVFRTVWHDHKDAILMTIKMLEECAVEEASIHNLSLASQEKALEKLNKSLSGLRRMRSLEEISQDEYAEESVAIRREIDLIQCQIDDLKESEQKNAGSKGLDMVKIKEVLDQWFDFSSPTVADALIDQFILQVVLVDDNTFNFTLDLDPKSSKDTRLTPGDAARAKYYRRNSSVSPPIDTMLSGHIAEPTEIFSFEITAEDAANYCREINLRFYGKKWHDKKIIISI